MPLLEAVFSEQILAAFYYVYRARGFGFLESVYRVNDRIMIEVKATAVSP